MTELATSKQIKSIDTGCGIDSRELMQNAAECLFNRIQNTKDKYLFSLSNVCIVCGTGNNGGDGYALAILLAESGCDVRIVAADRPSSSDALYYFSLCSDMDIPIIYAEEQPLGAQDAIMNASLVVDALFGIGLSRAPEEPYDELICAINDSDGFVFSVDIPSGIYSDSATYETADGQPLCVRADVTSTFVMKKAAHASYPSLEMCGEVYVEDIGIPPEVTEKEDFTLFLPDDELVRSIFMPRKADCNKGDFGTLVMLCGCDSMTGAASLAAQAAARCGVGLEVCCAARSTLNILQTKLDFPVFMPLATDEDGLYTTRALDMMTGYPRVSAILAGCGLGRREAAVRAVKHILTHATSPLILDADALNIISQDITLLENLRSEAVLTPHPGEMARLCGKSVDYIQHHRIEVATEFAQRYGVTLLLKGCA
ncbi:MAG: NAD(P)H-hydrate epimerase, partial [Clostridia bacterium]|nr:NAD(P)H-hydrate epimerase [Clostridia bacterium]